MANNTIEIKITAENSQALSALKQLSDAAKQAASKTNSAGESAGQGFNGSANEIQADGNKIVAVLNGISSTLTALASKFGIIGTASSSMQDVANKSKNISTTIVQETEKIGRSGVDTAAKVKKIGEETDSTKNKFSGFGGSDPFSSPKSSGEGFLGTLSKIGMSVYGIVETFRMVKEAGEKVFGIGLSYDQQMETAKMGIAGILTSMTTWNGEQMKLNQAMQISQQTIDQIQQQAVKIGLVPQDLITGFQSILGPGLQAKMTLEEIVQLTTMGTKAVKAMLGPQGNDIQVAQELRSMVSGNIDQDSQVSRALGITNADVEKAKQSAGGLFAYLKEQLGGFKALADEAWPNSMTGILEGFKAKYSQASGSAFESVFEDLKGKIKELDQALFTTDEQTKKVSFNPELLDDIKIIVSGTSNIINGIIETGAHLVQLASGPARTVLSVVQLIFDNVQQVLFTIIAWKTIETLRPILAGILRDIEFNVAAFKLLSSTAGTFQATLITTGTVIKGLLVTTGWGILAVAIGYVADQAFRLYDNLNKSNNAKKDYFKEKEAANAPIPQQLEGKLQAPQYDVNPDVNMGGMDEGSITKMEKFISAFNYMHPDRNVTVTSGYRTRGGHISGTKADLAIDGMEDPYFREQIINLAKQYGISVIDETEAPANPEEADMWGPHLDFNMGGADGATNNSGLGLKNQPQDTEALARAKVALADAIANGQLQEYIADLKKQEQSLENKYSKTNSGTANSDEIISSVDYTQQKKDVATARTNAEIAYLQQQINEKSSILSNKNLSVADQTNVQAEIVNLQSQINQKKIDLQTTIDGLDNAQNIAFQAIKDEATQVAIQNLKNQGKLKEAKALELELNNRANLAKFQSNGFMDAYNNLKQNMDIEQNGAAIEETLQGIDQINKNLAVSENDYLLQIKTGLAGVNTTFKDQYKKFNDAIYSKLMDLKAEYDNAQTDEQRQKIKEEYQKLNDALFKLVDNRIEAVNSWAQDRSNLVNAEPGWTSGMKQERQEENDRVKAKGTADAYGDFAAKLEIKDSAAMKLAKDKDKNPDLWAIQLRNLEAYYNKLAELPDLLTRVEYAGRQGLENGLNNFFESGYQKCHKLIDAVEDLAISILTEMNKVFSQQLTRNIMNSLYGASTDNSMYTFSLPPMTYRKSGGLISTFATGGDMGSGIVKGPGTSISDSILAWSSKFKKFIGISDGEYVVKGAAVKKYGTDFMDRLNNGLIPSGFGEIKAKYATGGALSGTRIQGPQELAASLVANSNTSVPIKIINISDPNEAGRYFSTRPGERVFLNLVKGNTEVMRRLLNIRG